MAGEGGLRSIELSEGACVMLDTLTSHRLLTNTVRRMRAAAPVHDAPT